nr:unnamed protein product [Callosobruchus analis]
MGTIAAPFLLCTLRCFVCAILTIDDKDSSNKLRFNNERQRQTKYRGVPKRSSITKRFPSLVQLCCLVLDLDNKCIQYHVIFLFLFFLVHIIKLNYTLFEMLYLYTHAIRNVHFSSYFVIFISLKSDLYVRDRHVTTKTVSFWMSTEIRVLSRYAGVLTMLCKF